MGDPVADFCADCVVNIIGAPRERNDLTGSGWWALCEGCGMHAFDDAGERMCGETVTYRGWAPCHSCNATIELLSDHPRTGAGRGIEDARLRPGLL